MVAVNYCSKGLLWQFIRVLIACDGSPLANALMPVVVTAGRKLPLGVHRVQVHRVQVLRVQANIPYQSMAKCMTSP